MFFKEKWFWRGTQSAAFYYLGCTPCVDWNYKRKRKNEALRLEKQRVQQAKNAVITEQPGIIPQPLPFQTNKAWAEEILAGPGPPSGYKREDLGGQLQPKPKRSKKEKKNQKGTDSKGKEAAQNIPGIPLGPRRRPSQAHQNETRPDSRPSQDRKTSTIDALKDTFRASLHPDKWNWIRYEREDEVLSGTHAKLSGLWDRATGSDTRRPSGLRSSSGRARADTSDSDQYDYYRARNPEINQYHPPIVSQLPTKRENVAWMQLPPPSAAVMEGRIRPGADSAWRQPLSRIGRTTEERKMRLVRKPSPVPSGEKDADDDLTSGTTTSTPTSINSRNSSTVWEPQRPPLAVMSNTKAPREHMDWEWGVVEVK